MNLQESLNIFLISEGCFFLSPSHDTALAFISSAENSHSNWFPLLCKIPLIRTEILPFLEPEFQLLDGLTVHMWSSHDTVPPLPGQGRQESWPSGNSVCAGQNFCRHPVVSDDGKADHPETHRSRQAGQPQSPLSPVSCIGLQAPNDAPGTGGGKTQQKGYVSAKWVSSQTITIRDNSSFLTHFFLLVTYVESLAFSVTLFGCWLHLHSALP